MTLILSEQSPENFYPLTLTRTTFELRYGALCPLDRAMLQTHDVALRCRPELAAYLRAKTGLPVNEDIAARGITGEEWEGLPASTPWDILAQSDKLIMADWEVWNRHFDNYRPARMRGVHNIGGMRDVFLGAGAQVLPGCVLDTSNGPIIIDEGATIKYSQIQGPVFIGRGCVIDGARLRPGASLGPNCKVGGEVAATIFQSRVNKAHDGFVGHTWAGRWVNFGAGATTSNLKNTYGKIRYQRDQSTQIDTGVQFLGAVIGDHTKIGILQGLNTGSNIGPGCNVFGGGIAPKYIPSFSWGGADGLQEHRIDDCLKTVHATLSRRNARLRRESEAVLRHVFEVTRGEREKYCER